MLNSKYAPVIAGAVLGVLLIGGLGWFLAIRPATLQALQYKQEASELRDNAALIQLNTEALAVAEKKVKGAEDLDAVLALHAPSDIAINAFRTRVDAALLASGVQLYGAQQAASQPVDGWLVDPAKLPSNALATLFANGPKAVADRPLGPYSPLVTAPTEPVTLVEGLGQIPFTFSITGTPAEIFTFIALLEDKNARLFQVYDVELTARAEGSAPILGVADAVDGDATAKVSGVLYFMGIPETPEEDGALIPQGAPAGVPFIKAPDALEQPGG